MTSKRSLETLAAKAADAQRREEDAKRMADDIRSDLQETLMAQVLTLLILEPRVESVVEFEAAREN